MKTSYTMMIRRMCYTALFMAMIIVLSSFGVPVPGGHLYLNDVVICLASVLLGPVWAMVAAGVGAFLGDAIFYPAPMYVSLVTRALQGLVISLISHYTFRKHPKIAAILGVAAGAVIMVVGYSVGREFFYGKPGAWLVKLPYQILQAVVGGVLGLVLCFACGIRKLYLKSMPELPERTDTHENGTK